MPKRQSLKKVLVIGSGPVIIGQAAEFDYAGTQACISLKEEGLEVVLINSNPATIMTDADMADRVYLEPLTAEFVAEVIRKEKPDGLLPSLGGQTGLNLAAELAKSGVLGECGVELLGTSFSSIAKAEDRQLFKDTMLSIGEPVPQSTIAENMSEALGFATKVGFPLVVRPAYTLGGTGGGIVHNQHEFEEIIKRGLGLSPIHQVLVEESVSGYKEIEYEVMRDSASNCITICNMENLDPMGVHTGDSVVVAPSQTLSDRQYQMLRSAAIRIINSLGVEGGCNIQFALDPKSDKYYVIEVNPRVSRSSALASKATGYPIARIAAKIAIGLRLDEITNPITGKTYACFEPALDYVTVKIPRWPFDKFRTADRSLGTQMKSTGEVMAIGRTFEEALLKAIRSLEQGVISLTSNSLKLEQLSEGELNKLLENPNDLRLFAMAEALRRGMSAQYLNKVTSVDPWFLTKISNIVTTEQHVKRLGMQRPEQLNSVMYSVKAEDWQSIKRTGIADGFLASTWNAEEELVRSSRIRSGVVPTYKMVDTCAAEFEAATPYFYSSYEDEDETALVSSGKVGPKVLVIGSGPIRIGQGIEFDYCCVQAALALRQHGYEALMINNNPETVSTDYSTSNRLYFEPLTSEDIINVVERERVLGVLVQFGGQTAINVAKALANAGVTILGTSQESLDVAEDRGRFDALMEQLNIPRPPGKAVTSVKEAIDAANHLGFPVLVRPSYVLGGRGMEIVRSAEEIAGYAQEAALISENHPILVDKYIEGREVEVDAICDGHEVIIPGIMEHVERAGIHSGDSIAVYPPQNLTPGEIQTIVEYTTKMALGLHIRGLLNAQFVIKDGIVYVLEVNPRASRTVPFLSKVTGIPMVRLATNIALGARLRDMGYDAGLKLPPDFAAVKVPVFSFPKLPGVDTIVGPEMKSTGEVIGIGKTFSEALAKGFTAAGIPLQEGGILFSVADEDKKGLVPIIRGLSDLGMTIYATPGTGKTILEAGIPCKLVRKSHLDTRNDDWDSEPSKPIPTWLDLVNRCLINIVVDTKSPGNDGKDGFFLRRSAVEHGVACLTSVDTVAAFLQALKATKTLKLGVCALQEYQLDSSQTRERLATPAFLLPIDANSN